MKHVWLCGASEKVSFEDSNNWRKNCLEWFENNSKTIRGWNPNDYYNYSEQLHKTDAEIFRFCNHKIEEADVILVNLDNVRQSVGSIMELAWAKYLNKPIIGFYEYEAISFEPYILTYVDMEKYAHPWVCECCDRIETGRKDSMYDALDYIEKYYGEGE